MLHMFKNGYYLIKGSHIELHFNEKPSDSILKTLHLFNWHWDRKGKYWSNYNNKENLEFAESIFEKPDKPKKSNLKMLPQREIGIEDIVTRCNSFFCSKNHYMIEIAGRIEIVEKSGQVKLILVPMYYCANCNRYYILEETANQLRAKGICICRIVTEEGYNAIGVHWGELKPESILKQYGYSVSQEEDLSDEQRQHILARIVDNKIITKQTVLSYLDFFCKLKGDNKADNSVYLWKKDRDFVSNYKLLSTEMVNIKI